MSLSFLLFPTVHIHLIKDDGVLGRTKLTLSILWSSWEALDKLPRSQIGLKHLITRLTRYVTQKLFKPSFIIYFSIGLLQLFPVYGQDFGFLGYWQDSTLHRSVIAKRVKSIREFTKLRDGNTQIQSLNFDDLGRITTVYFPSLSRDCKISFIYNNKGELMKELHFDCKDTSKPSLWIDLEYNTGSLVKEVTASYDIDGKYYTDTAKTEILQSSKEYSVKKKTKIQGSFKEITLNVDSMYGDFKFNIVTTRWESVKPERGSHTSRGQRDITRQYFQNNTRCEDIIRYYLADGRVKLGMFISTCSRFDKDKRKTDKIHKVFVAAQENNLAVSETSDLARNPRLLLQALDEGKLPNARTDITRYIYDNTGLLIEKSFAQQPSTVITNYKYNKKGELVEVIESPKNRTVYTYNDRGFISNIKVYGVKTNTNIEELFESTDYKFDYYD